MKKLAGLLVFAAALAGAIALTKYYSSSPKPQPVPPWPPPVASPPASPASEPASSGHVTFKVQLATLDFATGKGHTTLALERDPSAAAPEKVWVWTYFFASDAVGERRYCAGEPVEVRQPFTDGSRASVNVTAKVKGCAAPSSPAGTYYARVNVSTESAFAARLSEGRISYDVTQAVPVTVENARPPKR